MKNLLAIAILCIFFTSCEKEQDPFLITATNIGKLTKDIKVSQLDSIYSQDSIVNNITGDEFINGGAEIDIYEKGGTYLLHLAPSEEFDSTSTIANIRVIDDRYKTEKGLTVKSTFKDIQEFYPISRIENTLSSAVIFIDEINAYVTIDEKQLPSKLQFDTSTKIEASQIPDNAVIKQFWVGWE